MEEKAWRYGCLFCRTGTEASAADYINQAMNGIKAIAPVRTRHKTVAGKVIEDKVQLCLDISSSELKTRRRFLD